MTVVYELFESIGWEMLPSVKRAERVAGPFNMVEEQADKAKDGFGKAH
jgi:hypothetical protein